MHSRKEATDCKKYKNESYQILTHNKMIQLTKSLTEMNIWLVILYMVTLLLKYNQSCFLCVSCIILYNADNTTHRFCSIVFFTCIILCVVVVSYVKNTTKSCTVVCIFPTKNTTQTQKYSPQKPSI